MSLPLILFWIIIVSGFSILGAYYARKYNRPDALIGLYVTAVIFANLTASKAVVFDFGFTQLFTPVAVLIFAVTFLLTDIVNERFGRKETQRMILIALFAQVATVLFSYLVVKSEPAPFFQNQQAFESIFGSVPRIIFASFVAFFVSENFDAYIFHWFKKLTNGRHLWMRNVFSSLPAMVLDSVLVVFIAFYGVLPVTPLIIGLSVTKWFVGIIDIPFMYFARAVMGKHTSESHSEVPLPYSGI